MKLADLRVDVEVEGRADWRFAYRSPAIAAACTKQATYHAERRDHWTTEAEKIEAGLREKGIELREQQVTGGTQFSAVVDPQLGAQLNEARQRRDRHARSARTFTAWAAAFAVEDRVWQLSIDDVDYFALHREPGD